ncbi:MAG: sugar phosphate nucleotidyltransferase [Nanoarchaeota archaeon]|nr:NTP transferase domain-containing protein [Nanoarchaeota archaeon]MBU1030932.1 NTP transferase domain-containing protein [Nanoarchaeota archaeon]MBU1850582.1 NTP transferase domain-containing protein [Nanoarchaeota archaeon]
MKERVTLTIERSILEQIDKTIDKTRVKNRSHAVEMLLRMSLGSNKPTKALILAGGKGTRLKELANGLPKPLILIKGKPIIQYTIELLRKFGINDIILSVGYKSQMIKDHFRDGNKLGVNITYIEEDNPLGTAGPLKLAKSFLNETFILCNADELKDIDLNDMFTFHKSNRGLVTIALTTVDNPCMYGVALLNGNKIMTFIEKPELKNAPSNLINAGLYIMEPEVIDFIPEGYAMLENDVFPKLAQEEKLFGYPFSGQWFDTGTPQRFKLAEEKWNGIL